MFFISTSLFAQSKQISGLITGQDGEPIIGASIVVKGTYTGTVTDFDGKYTIGVEEENSFLVFSFLGMKTIEMPVAGKTTINVAMENETIGMDEVVVVGYGTAKKVDLTGSVAAVKGDKLNTAPSASLVANIAGKLTGVVTTQLSGSPGFEDNNIVIRGKGTQNNSDPLVLVDGVEREWSRIDPNDIASMTVLKDAASTAIYGARAANGVILVTTKRGKEGKPTVNYNASYGFQKPTKILDYLNSYDYARYSNQAFTNANDGDATGLDLYTAEQLEGFKNGTLTDTDWIGEAFDNSATIQTHNVSLSGGQEAAKYFLSVGMMDQNGLYDISNFKRFNARLNVDAKVNDYITIGMDMAMRSEDATRSPEDDDELWLKTHNTIPTHPANLPEELQGLGAYAFSGFDGNPDAWANDTGYKNVGNDFYESTIKMNVVIPWVQGLSVNGRYSFDKRFTHDKQFKHGYDTYSYSRGTDEWSKIPDGVTPSLTEWKQTRERRTIQTSINYTNTFGKHKFTGLLLFERNEEEKDRLTASRTGFISNDVDYLFAGNPDQKDNDGSASEQAREGYVGRVDYNYANKYYFQVNGRYDGSYRFAPGQRFGFFPSASAAWRLTEENFMKDASWLDLMKVRSSYGILGNDNLAAFQYLGGYSFDGNGRGYNVGGVHRLAIAESTAANEDVSWESTATFNIGLDLGMFDGKFSFEGDYFYRHTTDMLINSSGLVPQTAGITLPKTNSGEMEVKGFEILARHRNTVGDFEYTIEGTMTYAKNELLDVNEADDVLPGRKKEGRSIGTQFGYKSDGLFQSQAEIDAWGLDQDKSGNSTLRAGDIKYVDQNDDGILDVNDIVPIANTDFPEIVYGINLALSYKGFGLTANFQGATNVDREIYLDRPFNLGGVNTIYEIAENSWTPENTNARYPRLVADGTSNNSRNTTKSDFWYRSGGYCRLKNLQLDYSFSSEKLKSLGLGSLRVYVAGTNLLTFSKTKYEDPEVQNTQGHLGIAPLMSSYTMGLNVSF
ncbi:MAG: TonB-dependent receptor [Labilibaculum sp.]|nr:TonB-dependent receptor [Labilibaculum sp.]MBI9057356.1 TonB-dependent receptor [Labilibaculum sp.]